MRVSITGGLGFIGAALGSTLSAAGHDVLLTDIRDDDAAAPGTNYIQGSVLDLEDCHVTCEDMDVVVHCAAIHQASIVAKNPLSSIEINVAGTLNLLNAAIAAGAKRFIYVSSGKVFGEPEKLPSVETELPKPREAYALSKLTGEYYCQLLQAQSKMDIVIVRPFSVYGPEQDLNTGYVGMILQSLRDGSELRLPGRPDYVRDFVHIDDVVRLCSLVTTAPLPGLTDLTSGSGQPTSLHKLVSLAAEN